jgi:VanZ family protein
MNKMKIFMAHYWKTISISLFILILCLLPASELDKIDVKFTMADVIVHLIMFLVFSIVLFFDSFKYLTGQHKRKLSLIITVLVCLFFGILTETLQHKLVFLHRSGNFLDFAFDLIGTGTGIGVISLIKQKPDVGF